MKQPEAGRRGRAMTRGFWKLRRFLALPRRNQDAILRVAMERAAAEAEAQMRDVDDWADYNGTPNWIDQT